MVCIHIEEDLLIDETRLALEKKKGGYMAKVQAVQAQQCFISGYIKLH